MVRRMLVRLVSAFRFRASRPQSFAPHLQWRRQIAKFVPCRMHQFADRPERHLFPPLLDRVNRSLLTDAFAAKEADASRATPTKRERQGRLHP